MLYVNTDGSVSLTRGDTARISVTIKNSITGQTYVMQSGDTLKFTVKKSVKDSTFAFQKVSTGTNSFRIDPTDTNTLSFGKYVYDVQLTTANSEVYTVIEPTRFVVLEEVS